MNKKSLFIFVFLLTAIIQRANAQPRLEIKQSYAVLGDFMSIPIDIKIENASYSGVNGRIELPRELSNVYVTRGNVTQTGEWQLHYQEYDDETGYGIAFVIYSNTDYLNISGNLIKIVANTGNSLPLGAQNIFFESETPNEKVNVQHGIASNLGVSISHQVKNSSVYLISDTSDFDQDGILDIEDLDDDGDGISDAYELANYLNPLFLGDAELDADNDGFTNLAEYQSGTSSNNSGETPLTGIADTNPPVFTAPDDIIVSAVGPLTPVDFGLVVGLDDEDGVIDAIPDHGGPYQPGVNSVNWTVRDQAGNEVTDTQLVMVSPLVEINKRSTAKEGDTAEILISLNGEAFEYPVTIPFTLSGVAMEGEDYPEIVKSVNIESGVEGILELPTLTDDISEGEESIEITLENPTNAVLGENISSILTLVEENLPPNLTVDISQGTFKGAIIDPSKGVVSVSPKIVDSSTDTHVIDWSQTDAALLETLNENNTELSFNPDTLPPGLYDIVINVTDDKGLTSVAKSTIKILESSPELSAEMDADGDGLSDNEEGLVDEDGDLIPAYLDTSLVKNYLPALKGLSPIFVDVGYSLRLGKTALSKETYSPVITRDILEFRQLPIDEEQYHYENGIYDIEILTAPGDSVSVIVHLAEPINDEHVVRLMKKLDWQDFSENNTDSISGAFGEDNGCPSTGSFQYSALLLGARCLELVLTDGGDNDYDGAADGVISLTAGVAKKTVPQTTDEQAEDNDRKGSGGETSGGGAIGWNIVLLLFAAGCMNIFRKFTKYLMQNVIYILSRFSRRV